MRTRPTVIPRTARLALVIAVLVTPASARAQSANALLQQAVALERVDGKVSEAIVLYKRVIEQFAGDRAIVARALLQMGAAQERQGSVDARRAYERVVRDYADQNDAATEARRRIAALAASATEPDAPSTRRIWRGSVTGGFGSTIGVSADGRYMSYVRVDNDWGTVVVRDIASGAIRSVSETGDSIGNPAPQRTAISPDGKSVAYTWFHSNAGRSDIRLSPVDGGRARPLVKGDTGGIYTARVYDFTPDGQQLIVGVAVGETFTVSVVAVADGRARPLMQVSRFPTRVRVSPDGRNIVYDLPQDSTGTARDIYVRALSGGPATTLVSHPADDVRPLWTPDGSAVYFVSDRAGAAAGFLVRVANGAAVGAPVAVPVKHDQGSAPAGFSRDGALIYTNNFAPREIHIGEIDMATGRWIQPLAPLPTMTPGGIGNPEWSPDAKRLAYAAGGGQASMGNTLKVYDAQTRTERSFPVPFEVGRMRWSPDGQFVLIASGPPRRATLNQVDTRTGAWQRVVEAPVIGWGTAATYSPDGAAIYYVTSDTLGGSAGVPWRVVRRERTTGAERTIYTGAPNFVMPDLAVSPDGNTLAIAGTDAYVAIPTDGSGAARVVRRGIDFRRRLSFDATGRELVHISTASPTSGTQLWATPIDGSAPRRVAMVPRTTWEFVLAADGRHVAARVDDFTAELWRADGIVSLVRPR